MDSKIVDKLNKLKSVFDTDKYLSENNTGQIIRRYYKLNRLAYRLFHNKYGFMHMGISKEATYTGADLLEPLNQIASYLKNRDGFKVLELGSGQG